MKGARRRTRKLTRIERLKLKNDRLRKKLEKFSEQLDVEWADNKTICNEILKNNEARCNLIENGSPLSNKQFLENIKRSKNERTTLGCTQYDNCRKILGNTLSGDEPFYNPDKWGNPIIQNSHNCYAYFLDDVSSAIKARCREECIDSNDPSCDVCSHLKPQPGKCDSNIYNQKYTCKDMIGKILTDNPNCILIRHENPSAVKCPKGYYKGAMVVDENDTYHFYRQDNNGSWSHKQGTLPIERVDSESHVIYDLDLAEKNYGSINYQKKPCAYFFIPKNSYLDTRLCS
tara:strand:- start:32187 stop:33050 length:864 start_codon:yes stop_codon:yes gene_type:complete